MSCKRWVHLLSLAVILGLLLAGCAQPAKPTGSSQGQPTAKPSGATPEPQAPGTEGPAKGGSIIWADYEPNTLNPYIVSEAIARPCALLVNRGLVVITADGTWAPMMAAELPTEANGGIKDGGKTITWKLRPGLKWSDGEPLTSDDIKFTWEAVSNPKSTATQTQGFDLIEAVETPDELTAVVKYKEFYVAWISQFALGILPRHATGAPEDMGKWEWNRTMDPTNGPFLLKEWQASDHLTFVRNPYWFEEGKPYLDEIQYPLTADLETQRQMMLAGTNDVHHWLEPDYVDQFMSSPQVDVQEGASPYWYRVQFKLSERGDPRPVPEAKPHAILGDVKVRKAISLALDRKEMVAHWKGTVFMQSMFQGEFACDLPEYVHDPEQAKALLEEAGWVDVDNDGIRECQSCQYAEPGSKLRLEVSSYSGWNREDEQVVMVQQLKEVGVDAYIQNHEPTVLYGTWGEGSPARKGDFDIMWWDYELGADPHTKAEDFYASWRIASEEVPGGFNCTRISDPDIDQWLKAAGSTTDVKVRQEAYCNIATKIYNDIMSEYVVGVGAAYLVTSSRLKGAQLNEQFTPFAMLGWDAENWYIEE